MPSTIWLYCRLSVPLAISHIGLIHATRDDWDHIQEPDNA